MKTFISAERLDVYKQFQDEFELLLEFNYKMYLHNYPNR